MLFEKGHKYIIEWEKNPVTNETMTYTGIVILVTPTHIELETIRGENVGLRIAEIKRKTELTEGDF
jgi:hypothetical protein